MLSRHLIKKERVHVTHVAGLAGCEWKIPSTSSRCVSRCIAVTVCIQILGDIPECPLQNDL